MTAPGLEIVNQRKRMTSRNIYIPILEAHALDTGADTDIDHARLYGIGDVSNGLEATGALSVETLDSRRLREASNKSSSTEFSSTATRRKD